MITVDKQGEEPEWKEFYIHSFCKDIRDRMENSGFSAKETEEIVRWIWAGGFYAGVFREEKTNP